MSVNISVPSICVSICMMYVTKTVDDLTSMYLGVYVYYISLKEYAITSLACSSECI